jgi:hypothetical protein
VFPCALKRLRGCLTGVAGEPARTTGGTIVAVESVLFAVLIREIHSGLKAMGSNIVVVVRFVALALSEVVAGAATARLVTKRAKTSSTPPKRTLL